MTGRLMLVEVRAATRQTRVFTSLTCVQPRDSRIRHGAGCGRGGSDPASRRTTVTRVRLRSGEAKRKRSRRSQSEEAGFISRHGSCGFSRVARRRLRSRTATEVAPFPSLSPQT
ncbi:hypothetical protein GN956_G22872 [Arapaima gigas]